MARTGKVTAAVSAAQMLVTSACWESAVWADLTGCTTAPAATFALLAAFGVPADTPDMNPLQVRSHLNMDALKLRCNYQ